MKRYLSAVASVLFASAVHAASVEPFQPPDLMYLQEVNQAAPTADPQLIFLLSAQYGNANLLKQGIESFEEMLQRFAPRITPVQRAMYLAAEAPLRAAYTSSVPAPQRGVWLKQTLAMLDEANKLTGGDVYITRWMSGIVRAGLPQALGETGRAKEDLEWCEANPGKFPHPGWLRDVYFELGAIHRAAGDSAKAESYLARSGYQNWDKPLRMTAPISVDDKSGNTFSARTLREIVPGKVFQLGGIDFTQYYFIISSDRKHLISIDAGARPDSAKDAYEMLKAHIPNLPPLTTVFVTHAHWDHVGGHKFFRELSSAVKFYGRENNAAEQAREATSGRGFAARFFGESFSPQDVWSYKPDVKVDRTTRIDIGGTHFELVPASGGETEDALMVFMPGEGIGFVGDVLMPYLGGPFLEEGSLDGLFGAIHDIKAQHAKSLLHGHDPLTRVFGDPAVLDDVEANLRWLRAQVIERMRQGLERGAIQRLNLMPPGVLTQSAGSQLAYLVERENTINRVYDQHSGYWQAHLEGMDSVTLADKGQMLMDYLKIDEAQIAAAARRMIADGRLEQAAMLTQWARARAPVGPELDATSRMAYAKLAEHYQEFNPFKFIIYTGEAKVELTPVNVGPTAQ